MNSFSIFLQTKEWIFEAVFPEDTLFPPPVFRTEKQEGNPEVKQKTWAPWMGRLWFAACVNTVVWANGDKGLAHFNASLYKHL